MPKTFLFRVTQEGVDELRKNLEVLGPAGQRAFQVIADASPRLANSLGQAQTQVDKTRSQLEALRVAGEATAGSLQLLNKGLALFGLGLGIEKIIEFGKRSIENVGALKDLSTQIGVTTKDLQVYQYAARQVGVSSQAMQTGLATLTREIGDAVAGNKEAIDLFRRLGVAYKDTAGNARDTGAAARDLAQRIHDSATAAQQGAIAHDSLGKAGRELLPIFKDGAAGLDAFAASAQKAGEVLSDETIERLNKADTTFKNLGAHLEIFFAQGIDNGIEVGKAFGYMADQFGHFVDHSLEIDAINKRIAGLRKQLQDAMTRYNLNLYPEEDLHDDQRRIGELIAYLQKQLHELTNPAISLVPAVGSEPAGVGHPHATPFVYKAASSADLSLQAGADQISILRQTAGLTPAQRTIEQARLTALYGAQRNPDPSISGNAAKFADQAQTQAILKQTQAIADENRQIELNIALTGKAADAWLKSEAAGQRADAERQGQLQALTTGYSAAAATARILAQQATQAAEKGAQDLAKLQQQAVDLASQAAAAANGPAALAAEQLAEKIAETTKDLKAALENAADPETAERLRKEIKGIADALTEADESARALKLHTALGDQRDEIASLQKQYELVGQISGERAVQVAHLEAINQLLRDGDDLNTVAAKQYIANAEQIAGLKDELAISERDAELMLEPYKNAIQGIQGAWTDGWEQALSGNIDTFSEFFDQIKQIGIRWAAEMASLMTFRPVAGSVLGAIAPNLASSLGLSGQNAAATASTAPGLGGFAVSAAPVAAMFGGASGASSGLGSWLFGAAPGATAGNVNGLFGSLPGLAGFLNSGAGTGLVGGLLSAGITAASGGSALQSGIAGGGALLGGLAGSVFGMPMIGAALGGIAGNLIGSLFGDKEKKPPKLKSITDIVASGGLFGVGKTTTSNIGDQTSQLGTSAAGALNNFLSSIGGTVSGQLPGANQLLYYGRTPRYMSIVGGANHQFGNDQQGAEDAVADFIARTMVAAAKSDKLKGVSDAVKTAIANSGATDAAALDAAVSFGKFYDRVDKIREPAQAAAKALADLTGEMSKATDQAKQYGLEASKIPEIMRQNFADDIADQILQLTDPNGFTLKQLDLQKAAALAQAQKLGADLLQVEELYGLKRKAIVEQGLAGVNDTFQAFFDGLLTDGNLSALSPQEQYRVARANFESADASTLQQASQALLQASRMMYASTEGYAADFRAVLEKVKDVGGLSAAIPTFGAGGDFPGGMAIAGEFGPELVSTGAARFFDAGTTAKIMQAANADLSPDLMASIVRSLGRNGDTELAHLMPSEIAMLIAWRGGPPSFNPDTGLMEFSYSGPGTGGGGSKEDKGSSGGGKSTAGGTKVGPVAPGASVAAAKAIAAAKAANKGNAGGTKAQDEGYAASAASNVALNWGAFGNATVADRFIIDKYLNDPSQKITSDKEFWDAVGNLGQRFVDYNDSGNTTAENIGNFVASLFGFNEINPLDQALGASVAGPYTDWGFDPAGLIGSIAGMAFGLPFVGGILADQISKLLGRPLEMNLGPSVFGQPSPNIAGIQNGLAAQGASDISLGSASISANSTLASLGAQPAGVLAPADVPRSLSSVVVGGQNGLAGSIQTGFARTSKGNDAIVALLQQLQRQLAVMTDKLDRLVGAQSMTNDVLKVQARGSTRI